MKIFETTFPDLAHVCYLSSESPEMPDVVRDAMLVLPGGGYEFCSEREAEPIVKQYLAAGMNCFLLYYSVGKAALYPQPLVEASLAVKYIRDNAAEFNVDPNRIFAVGFSAGGHLCAALGTFWNAPWLLEKLDIPYGSNKPNATVLSYAVISSGEKAHKYSFYKIIGTATPTDEELDRYSVEKHVSADTAPAFIWHTADDPVVPVENALLMASALSKNKIPFELHIFPHGPHGIALANKQTRSRNPEFMKPDVAAWIPLSIAFFDKL